METIKALWHEHETSPFPMGFTGKTGGCDLFVLDAEVGTSIVAFIEGEGRLVPRRREALKGSLSQLSALMPQLNEAGQRYFGRLLEIGRMVAA